MKQPLLFIVALLVVQAPGCHSHKPAGMPKLYPCNIKIVDKSGEIVENASVTATNPDSKWASIGLTGPDGIAEMKTNGMYPGVPLGTYKVLVTKYDITVTVKSNNPEVSDTIRETLVFDKSFSDESTTPLEMTIEAKKSNDVSFEVF